MEKPVRHLTVLLLPLLFILPDFVQAETQVVNIYSARKEALILPLLEKFKKQTGIDFKLVTGKADTLLKRLEMEGKLSPADVFITVDAGRLHRAKISGVLQPVNNAELKKRIPHNLRDVDNYWFGLSQRTRPLIYATERVTEKDLSSYEALADAKWKGRICVRSSSNIYNMSLVASMIASNGIEKTEAWVRGLVANFARPPVGGDTDQIKAVAAGQCDLTIANTYYLGRLILSKKVSDNAVANKVAVFNPNQGEDDRGVHVNVSGIGITRYAKNVDAANRLLEFLVSDDAQAWYAEVNSEYPVVEGVALSKTVESFGEFKADSVYLGILGQNNLAAVKLMDRAGWR
ncbi:MAG: Fe(3+) ABC transporter substrate-binding protein [Proteobacteria bacterium]|nr:Fe(3+) ABC transporter substrate-binding protein [Pseudomonadota bacterium]